MTAVTASTLAQQQTVHHIPDQPDGIDATTRDLPDPHRAAARVDEYVSAAGDGLYDIEGGNPLYARDLEVLRRAVQAPTVTIRPVRTADEIRCGHTTAQHRTIDGLEADGRSQDRAIRELQAERDQARRERDSLANAMERAESVRIDRDDVIWRPVEGGWYHKDSGTLTLDQVHETYGPTRQALLIDIDEQDDADGTPGSAEPGAQGTPEPITAAHIEQYVDWLRTDAQHADNAIAAALLRAADGLSDLLATDTDGSDPAGAQDTDDLADRLAGRLADALGRLYPRRDGTWAGLYPATEIDRWRALLAEHADRATAPTTTTEA
jgi:hypothetical protein